MNKILFALLMGMFTILGCTENVAVPKPHAYPKIIFPVKQYRPFDATYCAFTFEQPVYAQMNRDTTFFDAKAGSDCWFNLDVPSLNATIHCSYYPITSANRLDELIKDCFEMVNKHNVKASYIEEVQFQRPASKVYGMVYNIEGPAASPYQFFMTDSTKHFLRGALYFRAESRPDSLAPAIEFMKKDINHLVETLKWQ